MNVLKIEAINDDFAARITDIDLAQELGEDAIGAIGQAIAQYAVLVFPNQPLTDDQHSDFTRRFGSIDKGLLLNTKRKRRLENVDVMDLANVDMEGNVLPATNIRNVSLIANQYWHADSSFKNPAGKYSILCGINLPATGGQTEFADQRAAYGALDEDMKARLEGLIAEHWAYHSRNMLGGGGYSQEELDNLPPVHWPMVHTIAESNRKSLYIGIHAREIQGIWTPEARMLLHDLLEHATQRQFVYRHEWTNHDVVMWDNQCTLHRGRAYELGQLRQLRRCTTEAA